MSNYLLIHVHIVYMIWTILAASEGNTDSKLPRMINLTSDLKKVIPITYYPLIKDARFVARACDNGSPALGVRVRAYRERASASQIKQHFSAA